MRKRSETLDDSYNENPIEIALSIAQLMGQLCEIYQHHLPEALPNELLQFSHGIDLFWKIYIKQSQNPFKIISLQQEFSHELTHIFVNFNSAMAEESVDHKMFSHNVWRKNAYYGFIKKLYCLIKGSSEKWLHTIEDLDHKSKQQIHYYLTNFLAFLSPKNSMWSNPEVMEAVMESGGNNLLRGFRNYLEDLVLNNGQFNIKMTDTKAFEVGVNLAVTPGKVIFQNDLMQLIQYEPSTEQVYKTPILFVPPWINKYYVLDLSPHNSLVKWLVDQGHTVFMISWVNPDEEYSDKQFDDYMLEGPVAALDFITDKVGCADVHMVGYCIGGTLLACTMAYLRHKENTKVKSSTFFMSLLNFSNPGELGVFFDKGQMEALDKLMKDKGYLDGSLLDIAFNTLRPDDLVWPYYINRYLMGKPPKPFDLLYWNADSTNLPYTMYSYYLRKMYIENVLYKPGSVIMGDVPIDLSTVTTPSFFLSSETDHITLWKSIYSGLKLLGGPVEFIRAESGHVRGVINPPSDKKYGYWINNDFTNAKDYSQSSKIWMEGGTRLEGSWWNYWTEWLIKQNDEMIPARQIQASLVIEDAPGTYVLKKI